MVFSISARNTRDSSGLTVMADGALRIAGSVNEAWDTGNGCTVASGAIWIATGDSFVL